MFGRIGHDVLRAVAILAGLLVAGALLVATADPRVAQYRFALTDLGLADDPLVSIALDARAPGHVWASGRFGRGINEPKTVGSTSRAMGYGDLAIDAEGHRYNAGVYAPGIRVDVDEVERRTGVQIEVPGVRQLRTHVVARADGLIVVSSLVGETFRVWRSTDGARTFRPGGRMPTTVVAAGPVTVGPFASLFTAVATRAGLVGFFASADGGTTWSARGVKTASNVDPSAPTVALDDAATVYIAWTRTISGKPNIFLSHSRDVGVTWSNPIAAAPPGGSSPQLVAGSLGKIGLAYLLDGELVFRQTTEALLPTPFWTEHLVARGVRCPAPCERAPYELILTTRSRALLAARAAGRLIAAEQVSGAALR